MTRIWGIVLVSAFLAQGCAHYHLGAGPAPSFETLYIEPSKNKTTLAQSQVLVSTMVREAFIRDGRVNVVTARADADRRVSNHALVAHRQNAWQGAQGGGGGTCHGLAG